MGVVKSGALFLKYHVISVVLSMSVACCVQCRHDLELQLSCYNASEEKDKQTSTCNWPPEVVIVINDHTLPVDKVGKIRWTRWVR